MPSISMKDRKDTDTIREKTGVPVSQKSNVISKKTCSHIESCLKATQFDPLTEAFHCLQDFPTAEESTLLNANNVSVDHHLFLGEEFVDSAMPENLELADTWLSKLEIIASVLEHTEGLCDSNVDSDAGSHSAVLKVGTDVRDDGKSLCDCQTCNTEGYLSSDMIVTDLLFQEDITGIYPFQDDMCADPSAFFGLTEPYIVVPDLENNFSDFSAYQQSLMDPDNLGVYVALDEMGSCIMMSAIPESDVGESFCPELFIRDLPELSAVLKNCPSAVSLREMQRRKPVTLVLDLDETLVHSTVNHCVDADFTFTICSSMKERTVYVKQRPHLHTFLEKVAEMFEVVIFTASHSTYAERLLNILDPDGKLISGRAYRDSCILLDGRYTKDLTVLGVDLAKVAIIDNTPEVYRLQVNNGIPIKSWYDDPSDSALISLLPFLETLVDAEDVRPLIAKKFGNKE